VARCGCVPLPASTSRLREIAQIVLTKVQVRVVSSALRTESSQESQGKGSGKKGEETRWSNASVGCLVDLPWRAWQC